MKKLCIATLLTCHNRKEATLNCLKALYSQVEIEDVRNDVYLVDDGCTDGTGDAVRNQFPDVKVLDGDGNLYWCGGMRMAWSEAMKGDYDFYLWLNDDTCIYENAIRILLSTADAVREIDNHDGIIVGSTCDAKSGQHTYGGVRRIGITMEFRPVRPTSKPQQCDTMNGNCVLVPRNVATAVGNLSKEFTHDCGDYDYGLRAARKGINLWITPGYVGTCSRNPKRELLRNPDAPLEERLRIMKSSTGMRPLRESLCFAKRHAGIFWPLYCLAAIVRACCPRLWLWFNAKRYR